MDPVLRYMANTMPRPRAISAAATVMIAQAALVAPEALFDSPGGDIEAGENLVRLALTLQRDAGTYMNCNVGLETSFAAFKHHMGIDGGGEILADRRFEALTHMLAQPIADPDMSAFDG